MIVQNAAARGGAMPRQKIIAKKLIAPHEFANLRFQSGTSSWVEHKQRLMPSPSSVLRRFPPFCTVIVPLNIRHILIQKNKANPL